MAKLPRVTGQEMVRFLQREGFQLLRVRGSHHYFAKDELRTSVPVRANGVGSLFRLWTLHGNRAE